MVLDADPKVKQQSNFTGNLEYDGDTKMSFLLKKSKKLSQYSLEGYEGTVNTFNEFYLVCYFGIKIKWVSITVQILSYQIPS